MLNLKNKIVLITGASSGIGEAAAESFAQAGARLILAARREDKLFKLAEKLKSENGTDCLTIKLDVRQQSSVGKAIESLPAKWSDIDILINNAGLSRGLEKLQEGVVQNWEEMIDTNIKGLLYVSRAVMPGMIKRDRGHIVNLGSIASHELYPGGNVYCATKHAVLALTSSMRIDLLGTKIRVTTISPGMVETEFSIVRFHGDKTRADKTYAGMTPLTAEDIADSILYACTRPEHVNISEILIMPTDQAAVALVNRKKPE